jgi:hypothetical protein
MLGQVLATGIFIAYAAVCMMWPDDGVEYNPEPEPDDEGIEGWSDYLIETGRAYQ